MKKTLRHFLGIDGGGSSGRALVLGEDGSPVFEREGLGLNVKTVPSTEWQARVSGLLQDCPSVHGWVACLAGVLTPEDANRAGSLIQEQLGVSGTVLPDFCALQPLAPGAHLHVIAGTGSILVSFSENGDYHKSGGGGPLIGDVGSGFALGKAWLAHLLLPAEKADPGAELRSFWTQTLGSDQPNEVLSAIYQDPAPARLIAQHAEYLIRAAEREDPRARCILKEQMEALAKLAWLHLRVHQKLRSQVSVALAGGIWNAGPSVIAAFEQAMKTLKSVPEDLEMNLVLPSKPPVWGAAMLAKKRYT